ncbi:MAG: STAS domain-containing protein, partial [Betaproteobacteria bacterium]|nr:STAS domain-containing protein [Betaproteobacteria bacterium]
RKLAARLQPPDAAPAPTTDEPSISQAAPLTPADAAASAVLAGPGQAFMATQPPGQAISAQVVISAVPQVLEAMRFLPTQTSAAPAPDDRAAGVPGAARSSAEDDPVAAAALCLASGDVVGARDNLRAAIDEGGDLGQLARAWLELLWVLDEKDEFDRAVATFGRHCGAPWTTWRDRALRNDDICAFHATERLNAAEVHLLARVAAQADDPWQCGEQVLFNFVRVRNIDDDAFGTLAVAIKRLQSLQGPFVLQGATCLLSAIHQRMQSCPPAEVPLAVWHCQLEMLRLLGHEREFLECARAHHTHCGVPLAPWFACEARFSSYVATPVNDTAAGLDVDAPADVAVLSLTGEVTHATIDATVALLESRARLAQRIDVDCSRLVRVDFESAVSLLNWAHRCRQRGAALRLLNLGILSGALFRQVGLTEYAVLQSGPALAAV